MSPLKKICANKGSLRRKGFLIMKIRLGTPVNIGKIKNILSPDIHEFWFTYATTVSTKYTNFIYSVFVFLLMHLEHVVAAGHSRRHYIKTKLNSNAKHHATIQFD